MNESRPPGSPPLVADPRVRPWSTTTAAMVVIASAVVIALFTVGSVNARIDRLEAQVGSIDVSPMVLQDQTTTIAPPIDLPPADADAARREIVATFVALFGESTPEQRQALLIAPSELPDRLQALAGGPCAGARPVITHLSFLDDDRAEVRFRFEGASLPAGADGFSFDGFVARVDGRWLIDPMAPLQALDLGGSVCEP